MSLRVGATRRAGRVIGAPDVIPNQRAVTRRGLRGRPPPRRAIQLSERELAAGRTALVDKVRAWRPGLLLFAFRPPAEALLGKSIVPGRGPDFEGIHTFLLSGPYAPGEVAAAIDAELLTVLRDVRTRHGRHGSEAQLVSRQGPQLGARAAVGPAQPVTAADLAAGRIRLPARSSSDAKSAFPDQAGRVRIVLRGEDMVVQYDPRLGDDRERSGVLSVGSARLAGLVDEDDVLQISVNTDGVASLD